MLKLIYFILIPAQFAAAAAVKKPLANVDKRPAPASAQAPIVLTQKAPNFCIFGAQSGKQLAGEAAFKATTWKNDVVYVGAAGGEALDHMAQFEALKSMRIARGSRIAVAFAAPDQGMQPAFDDYAAGRISQEAFIARTDWVNATGEDFALYKPVFDFIAANKLRALALGLPKNVMDKLARSGTDSLSSDEKKYLAEKAGTPAHKKYGDYLKAAFDAAPPAAVPSFDNYAAAMYARDESMGARVADFLAANPGYAVLVLAGNGNIIYNAGLPAAVKARVKGVRQASFYAENAAKCPPAFPPEHKDIANYVWYMNHPPKAAAPAAAAPAAEKK